MSVCMYVIIICEDIIYCLHHSIGNMQSPITLKAAIRRSWQNATTGWRTTRVCTSSCLLYPMATLYWRCDAFNTYNNAILNFPTEYWQDVCECWNVSASCYCLAKGKPHPPCCIPMQLFIFTINSVQK